LPELFAPFAYNIFICNTQLIASTWSVSMSQNQVLNQSNQSSQYKQLSTV